MLQPVTVDSLCRACAKIIEENGQLEAIVQFQKLQDLYSTLSGLNVSDNDGLPKRFCHTCSGLLEAIIDFKEACAQSIDSIRKFIIGNLKEEPIEVVSAEPLEPILKIENVDTEVSIVQSHVKKVKVRHKKQSAALKKPYEKRGNEVRPMCALCGVTFVNVKGIRKHMRLELKRIEEKGQVKVKSMPVERHCTFKGCRRVFIRHTSLKKHMKMHKNGQLAKFGCSTCTERFDTSRKFKAHLLKQHPEKSLLIPCDICGFRVVSESRLQSHKARVHHPYICHHCGKVRCSKKSMRNHLIHRHTDPVYETCTICQAKLPIGLEEKDQYKVKGIPIKQFAKHRHCTFEGCRRFFNSQKGLDKHMKMHVDRQVNSKMRIFTCTTCKEGFSTAQKLKEHTLKLHPKTTDTVSCNLCRLSFASKSELKSHETRVHNPYLCHHCGKAHNSKDTILNHLINKHTAAVYETCTICHVKLLQAKLLAHCIQKHSVKTNEIIQCTHCNKEFKQKAMLKRHLKIHIGERKYVCHECGRSFLRLHQLKGHLYVHSGERPVHCQHCSKGFYNSFALKIHMNIHKREWIAQGQTGIELMVYATSNKSKNSTEKKYANLKQPHAQ